MATRLGSDDENLVLNKIPIKRKLKPETKSKRFRLRQLEKEESLSYSNKIEKLEQVFVESVSCEPSINLVQEALLDLPNPFGDTGNECIFLNKTTDGPPYPCKMCNMWFLVRDKLIVHYVTNHNVEHCSVCIFLFPSTHERIEHENRIHYPAKCEMCEMQCHDIWQVTEHYETQHDTALCVFCGVLVQPRGSYDEHIRRKHIAYDRYFNNEDGLKIVDEWTSKWHFRCRLCNKQRQKKDFFGHFHMHHKITIVCFLQIIGNENISIDVKGNINDDVRDDPLDQKTRPIDTIVTNSQCNVCSYNTHRVPFSFHQMYCQKLSVCKFCLEVFSDHYKLHYHKEQLHKYLECSLGCPNIVCPNERQLHVHYSKFHDITACKFCEIFVSADPEKYDTHLKNAHAIKDTVVEEILDSDLFTAVTREGVEQKTIVTCCLCEKNITDMVPNVENMYMHYTKDHSIILKALAVFNPRNPLLPDVDEESADAGSGGGDGDAKQTKDYKCTCGNPKDCCTCPKHSEDGQSDSDNNEKKLDETLLEPNEDFDPLEVECFIDDTSDDDDADADADDDNENAKTDDGLITSDDFGIEIKTEPADSDDENMTNMENLQMKNNNSQYVCEMCEARMLTKSELLEHAHMVHGFLAKLTLLTCDDCLETFTNASSYELHLINEHGKDLENRKMAMHACPFCTRTDTKKRIRKHVRKMHIERSQNSGAVVNNKTLGFRCRFCETLFWDCLSRNDHEVLMHFKDEAKKFFKCSTCYKIFSSKLCLKKHVHAIHKMEQKFDSSKLFYKCLRCHVLLPRLEETRDHFFSQHPDYKIIRCNYEGCTIRLKTKKTYTVHMKNVHHPNRADYSKPRGCELCGKWLLSERAAKTHYRMKHSEESRIGLGCRLCPQRFDTAEKRKYHYSTVHSGIRAFICSKCGKGFNSKSGLYGHRQLHMNHSFECEYCHKIFVRRDTYNEHLLIHSGPRHQCPYCPRSFTQRSNLTRHTRIHTGDKPYQCTMCPKRFSDKGACNSHIRVHTREEVCSCPYCGKTFSKKQKLTYHIRKHTGEGLVTCQTCSKVFTSSFSLKEHQITHEVGTQLLCTQCNRGFSHERYLRRHIIAIHTDVGRKFHCQLCDKKFGSQNQLNSHLLSHSGIKHTQCLLCEAAYASRKSIVRHLNEAHNISVKGDPQSFTKYTHRMTPEEAGIVFPTNLSGDQLSKMISSKKLKRTSFYSNRTVRSLEDNSEVGGDKRHPDDVEKLPVVVATKSRKIKKPSRYLEETNVATAKTKSDRFKNEVYLNVDVKEEPADDYFDEQC